MRVGICQYDAGAGDFKTNLAKVVEGLERADRDQVDVVCFPECFLTGYQDTEAEARKHAFASDSPQMMELLDKTARFNATFIVGYNELRGDALHNTAAVVYKGHSLGSYSKCVCLLPFHKPGREFPVFERDGVKFGVIICADGGYIEPARILVLKGARVIFAPHYNYIAPRSLIQHFMHVRHDHVARAVENMVHFVRANNVGPVMPGKDPGITAYDGQAYGDSYVIDPFGEMVVRTRRHKEQFVFADIDTSLVDPTMTVGRSRYSIRELSQQLLDAAKA